MVSGTGVICGGTSAEDAEGEGGTCFSKLETEAATWVLERRLDLEPLHIAKEGFCGFNGLVELLMKGQVEGEGDGEGEAERGHYIGGREEQL